MGITFINAATGPKPIRDIVKIKFTMMDTANTTIANTKLMTCKYTY